MTYVTSQLQKSEIILLGNIFRELKMSKSIVEQIEKQCLLIRREGFSPNVILLCESNLFALSRYLINSSVSGHNLHKMFIGTRFRGMKIIVDKTKKNYLRVAEISE